MTYRPAGSGDDDLAGADGRPAYEEPSAPEGASSLGQGAAARQIAARHARGRLWQALLHAATIVAVVSLSALAYNILNNSMGLVAYETVVDPESLAPGGDLEALSHGEMAHLLEARLSDQRLRALAVGGPLESRSTAELVRIVESEVVKPKVVKSMGAFESLRQRSEMEEWVASNRPAARIEWRRWWNWHFVTHPQSSYPEFAGVRVAILGSLWMIALTMATALPVGVAAGVYLEEYADRAKTINRIVQTNINNLAGVPSIIYGILGLTVFVRALEPITSGAILGVGDPTTANGRTILSASLTMALLILPVIIISTQEAVRTVPASVRQASYAVGATRWQTVRHHVLPLAVPGILTGTILSMSRALGETAPLVVVGASTYIASDPSSPFSKFTVLPMQIYQWTSRPQDAFRDIAAAAIVVLVALLLLLNSTAVLLRNRYSVRY